MVKVLKEKRAEKKQSKIEKNPKKYKKPKEQKEDEEEYVFVTDTSKDAQEARRLVEFGQLSLNAPRQKSDQVDGAQVQQ